MSTAVNDSTPCHFCHVQYGDPSDPRISEGWMKCCACDVWVHQSCGLDQGVEDDDGTFTCVNCVA